VLNSIQGRSSHTEGFKLTLEGKLIHAEKERKRTISCERMRPKKKGGGGKEIFKGEKKGKAARSSTNFLGGGGEEAFRGDTEADCNMTERIGTRLVGGTKNSRSKSWHA